MTYGKREEEKKYWAYGGVFFSSFYSLFPSRPAIKNWGFIRSKGISHSPPLLQGTLGCKGNHFLVGISSKISLAVYFFIFFTQKCEMHIFYRPTSELNVSKPRFQKK